MTALDDLPITPTTTTVRAACPHDCPDTCAMLVTVEDGRATKVAGDPEHPFTRGGLCVKVNNYQEKTYSPDRVLHPLRRTGPKGSGRFERDLLGRGAGRPSPTRFRARIAEHGPETVMPVSYLGTQGILNGLSVGDAFFNKLGATITERTYCDSGSCTAYVATIGATAGVDPESLVHSRYIIIWASNTISTNLHLWPLIAEAQKRGAKVVCIDPVRHRTAQRADWHIPIRPGTDGALALAMMNVIISEGLHRRGLRPRPHRRVRRARRARAHGTRRSGRRRRPASPPRTSARSPASTPPPTRPMIRIGVAIERHAGGGQTVRSLACLPALVGAWRHVGGGLLQLPLWAYPVNWPAFIHPELATPGTRVVNQFLLGRALTGEMALDPPITALMVYNSNPMVVCPRAGEDRAGAGPRGPVHGGQRPLPHRHRALRRHRAARDDPARAARHHVQLGPLLRHAQRPRRRAGGGVDPQHRAVPAARGPHGLRRRVLPPAPTRSCSAQAYDWSAPAMEGITLESLRETGWARLNLPGPDAYAPHAEGNFPTPSGKTEFRSSALEAAGNFVVPLFRQLYEEFQPGGTVDPLPHYIAPRETGEVYPLNLLSPKSHAYINSSAGDQAMQKRVQGEQKVTIHPADAEARGITDGRYVEVSNDRGRFVALADVSDEVSLGVVVCPMGSWAKNAKDGSTVNAVNPFVFADLGNAPTFSDTRVEVTPV